MKNPIKVLSGYRDTVLVRLGDAHGRIQAVGGKLGGHFLTFKKYFLHEIRTDGGDGMRSKVAEPSSSSVGVLSGVSIF